jgi:predicted transcriptional regulator
MPFELRIKLSDEEHARLNRLAKRHDTSPVDLLQKLVLLADEVLAERDAKAGKWALPYKA